MTRMSERSQTGNTGPTIEDEVIACRLDSRWDPCQLDAALVLAEREMDSAAHRIDEAIEDYRKRVRYWRLVEQWAAR